MAAGVYAATVPRATHEHALTPPERSPRALVIHLIDSHVTRRPKDLTDAASYLYPTRRFSGNNIRDYPNLNKQDR